MPFYLKMSQNINSTMRHLKLCYILTFLQIFYGLLYISAPWWKYLTRQHIIITLYFSLFENVTKYKLSNETFEILFYLDFLKIFYALLFNTSASWWKYLIRPNIVITWCVFLFKNVIKYKVNYETFEILLYFDFLQIFYGLPSNL